VLKTIPWDEVDIKVCFKIDDINIFIEKILIGPDCGVFKYSWWKRGAGTVYDQQGLRYFSEHTC
jgi:hypothetical protein